MPTRTTTPTHAPGRPYIGVERDIPLRGRCVYVNRCVPLWVGDRFTHGAPPLPSRWARERGSVVLSVEGAANVRIT